MEENINVVESKTINGTDTQLRIFAHDEFGKVRTVMIDGEVWFVGKDDRRCSRNHC